MWRLFVRTKGRFSTTYNYIQNIQNKLLILVLVCMKGYLQTQFEFNPETFGIFLTSHQRVQQTLTWGTVSSMYKYNSELQTTFGGTVATTGTETKTGFCITKTPYEEMFCHPRALNCEASSPVQLKFELHWDFMPVLVASKFEEDMIENEHHFFSPLKGTLLQNNWSDLAVIQTCLRFYASPRYL